MKNLIIILLSVVIIAGCKKENTTPTTPTNTNTTTTVNNDTTIVQKAKWVKPKYFVSYKADGVTEQTRTEFVYDAEGKVIEYTSYYNGLITVKQRDYVYTGDECTYYSDSYNTAGAITSTSKMKAAYLNE